MAKKLSRSNWHEPEPVLIGEVDAATLDGMSEHDAWMRVRQMRWPATAGEPMCPKCGTAEPYTITTRKTFKCKSCWHQFSAVSGTVFAQFKGGYLSLLQRLSHQGSTTTSTCMSSKTALNTRRKKIANTVANTDAE